MKAVGCSASGIVAVARSGAALCGWNEWLCGLRREDYKRIARPDAMAVMMGIRAGAQTFI